MSLFTDILIETHGSGWHELDYLAGREVPDGTAGIVATALDTRTPLADFTGSLPLCEASLLSLDAAQRVWLREWLHQIDLTKASYDLVTSTLPDLVRARSGPHALVYSHKAGAWSGT